MKAPKISYAITVCNEVQEFRRLLDFLVSSIRPEDEIVVLQDTSKDSEEINKIFVDFANHIQTRVTATFEGNFADWKNMLNSHCKGDYIFQIDADEYPSQALVEFLPRILEANSEIDLLLVPRANRVEGITAEDIERWGWRVVEVEGSEYINWPDYQSRIYRNTPQIYWEGKVHERITGFKKWSNLPAAMFLHHDKEIQKQRAQNAYYNQLMYVQ